MLVAAVARNGVIGVQGGLPWRLPEDLARFKAMTMGATLLMGRKTYDSIGRPLPGRTTVVITRQTSWSRPGILVAHSFASALALVAGAPGEVFVVGGGDVYALALPLAARLELTEVDAAPDGDAWFPAWDRAEWTVTAREARDGFAFVTYQRVGATVDAAAPGDSAEASAGSGSLRREDVLAQAPARQPRALRRLDLAVGALAGRLLPRHGAAAVLVLLGAAVGVLLGASALLVGTLLLGSLLWLPAAWAGLGVGLLALWAATHLLSTRRAPAGPRS